MHKDSELRTTKMRKEMYSLMQDNIYTFQYKKFHKNLHLSSSKCKTTILKCTVHIFHNVMTLFIEINILSIVTIM